jgi:hypothetical protein
MDVRELLRNSKLYSALHKSKYYPNGVKQVDFESGRYNKLPRFTKLQNFLLESLYTINDLHNPTAFRIYLYLLRQITGYKNKSKIEYRPKRIKKDMNIGNCMYKGIKYLKAKNMIELIEDDDLYYISLNPDPSTWITTSKEKIDKIMNDEINAILGKDLDKHISTSSSSWSSSSSSSASYPSDDDKLDDDLLKELEKL